jgi:hypothetical protein
MSTWKETLDQAKQSVSEGYHVFLTRFRRDAKEVYGFVEGTDDPSYYRELLDRELPGGVSLWLYCVRGKERVIETYNAFDWERFDKRRICFFVDRDFEDFLAEPSVTDSNIYRTDGYSIENSLFSTSVLVGFAQDSLRVHDLSIEEESELQAHIQREIERLCDELKPLTAQMLMWRRSGQRVFLNQLNMNELIVKAPGLRCKPPGDLLLLAAQQVNAPVETPSRITSVVAELEATGRASSEWTRGKQLLWFVVAVLLELPSQFASCVPRITKKLRHSVPLSQRNAVAILAPRCRCPDSLRRFITINYLSYLAA